MAMRAQLLLLTLALTAVSACSAQPLSQSAPSQIAESAQPSVHPVSGLEIIPLTVTSGRKVHKFRVEVAATPAQQEQGLMFRREMGANEGMIFPHEVPRMASFWMKNTVLPLDIIFVGPDRRIINIAANTTPFSLDPVPSDGPTSAVLELNAGRSAQLGLKPGDLVSW